MEIGVLPGACPVARRSSAAASPRRGTVARVAFEKGDTAPPAIGHAEEGLVRVRRRGTRRRLRRPRHGLHRGRRDRGARRLDRAEHDGRRDGRLRRTARRASAGRCVPSTNPDDPDLGAGCSMQLVGAGPLGLPLGAQRQRHRERAGGGRHRDRLSRRLPRVRPDRRVPRSSPSAAIDEGGALTIPTPTMLPSQCPGQDESDAVGARVPRGRRASSSRRGRRAPVRPEPASTSLLVDAGGNVQTTALRCLDRARRSCRTPMPRRSPALRRADLAFLEQRLGEPRRPLRPADLRERLALRRRAPADARRGRRHRPDDRAARRRRGRRWSWSSEPPRPTAELAVHDERHVRRGRRPGLARIRPRRRRFGQQPLAFSAFDLGSKTSAASGSFSPPGQGAVAGGDVASSGDRVFFAAEQPGSISIVVYDHASTTPTFLGNVLALRRRARPLAGQRARRTRRPSPRATRASSSPGSRRRASARTTPSAGTRSTHAPRDGRGSDGAGRSECAIFARDDSRHARRRDRGLARPGRRRGGARRASTGERRAVFLAGHRAGRRRARGGRLLAATRAGPRARGARRRPRPCRPRVPLVRSLRRVRLDAPVARGAGTVPTSSTCAPRFRPRGATLPSPHRAADSGLAYRTRARVHVRCERGRVDVGMHEAGHARAGRRGRVRGARPGARDGATRARGALRRKPRAGATCRSRSGSSGGPSSRSAGTASSRRRASGGSSKAVTRGRTRRARASSRGRVASGRRRGPDAVDARRRRRAPAPRAGRLRAGQRGG